MRAHLRMSAKSCTFAGDNKVILLNYTQRTMKKLILSLLAILFIAPAVQAKNVGVPAECEDVMLQAFYWDSYKTQSGSDSKYGRTKWVDLLKDTASINANFDLVWFPPSAYADGGNGNGGVGYTHKQLSKQTSDWGTDTKLKELITALHKGDTRVLADIVINHRGNKSNWCDFWEDNFGSYGSYQLTQQHICSSDEGFTSTGSTCYGADESERGNADTGSNFEGARDLDHTNTYVQNWAKAYVQWMINVMQYDGFRYDMTLGYHGRYLSMYNEASKPYLSVSELWDGIDRQVLHLQETNYNTMIFDFPLKYQIHQAIVGGSYGKLRNPSNSLRGKGYAKYAVTFLDNHDTFERESYGNNQFGGQNIDLKNPTHKNRILQGYAYILMMPGVPCVFWPHWKTYQSEINALIAARKLAGIHSESAVLSETTSQNNYEAVIQGHHGQVMLRLGSNRSTETPEGYRQIVDGPQHTVYYKEGAQGIITPSDSSARGEKILRDGQLYLKYEGTMYDVQGRKVK